jgi:hypothetical protein
MTEHVNHELAHHHHWVRASHPVSVPDVGRARNWIMCRDCRTPATVFDAARWAFRRLRLPERLAPRNVVVSIPTPMKDPKAEEKAAETVKLAEDLRRTMADGTEMAEQLQVMARALTEQTDLVKQLRAQLRTAVGENQALQEEVLQWRRFRT